MIEKGESCQNIGQQFSAVRNALDSTYLRMTVCFAEQEIDSMLVNGGTQVERKSFLLKDLETMLLHMR